MAMNRLRGIPNLEWGRQSVGDRTYLKIRLYKLGKYITNGSWSFIGEAAARHYKRGKSDDEVAALVYRLAGPDVKDDGPNIGLISIRIGELTPQVIPGQISFGLPLRMTRPDIFAGDMTCAVTRPPRQRAPPDRRRPNPPQTRGW